MNRRYNQFALALEPRVVTLYARVAIGASGAPTLNVAGSKGVASITRNSAGLYTVVLQDRYASPGLLAFDCKQILASGGAGEMGPIIRADNSAAAARSVQFVCLSDAGAAEDPVDGATLLLKFELKASSV